IQAIDFGIFKRRAPDVPDVHAKTISEEHEHRLEKVSKIREAGREPWPAAQEVNSTCKDVSDEFVEDAISRAYELAGRIVALREHGKTAFAHLQDRSGKLQIYIRQDVVGDEAYSQLKNFIDIGDFIWVRGKSFKTKTGEITLKVESFTLQSKCLHPLPEKFHGIADIEIKYRQRYLDLISSPESRERFAKRSKIIKVMRQFFDAHGYMEVETPMLHPIPGGAAARPFVTHHNALDTQLYLRIAPELYLKRLVVGGFERVYEINRNFRNEGISTRHNPEFTMVEFYTAYKDYHFAMDFVEKMTRDIVMETNNVLQVPFGELTIDFAKPFERLSMKQAVMKYGKIA
ncbi:MAG TPA: amino acid--tRNA ligase-related protein, partial [Aquirhabdus sp.]